MEKKLPDGWEWKKLGDLIELKYGKGLKKENRNLSGKFPVYGSNGVVDYHNEAIVSEPCLIVGRKGSIGAVNLSKTPCWPIDTTYYVIPPKELDLTFLFYLMPRLNLENLNKSTAIPGLNRNDVYSKFVPIPPLKTQQKIVSILKKAEETKKLRAQADELTQQLLQSVFLEMFGDPTKNSRGWDVRKLGEIITDSMNGLYLPKEKYTSHEGIKMVHMSDAFYGIVELGNMKRVLATKKEIDKYGLTKNDLLVARRSLNFEGAAKASRIPELNEPLIFESSLIKISPDLKLVTTIYLYHYLNNELVRKTYIYKHITKSTISGINQNSLKNISVILPPIEVQNKFSDFVEQAEKTILNQQQSSLEINTLFDALMQKAFTGELVS